MKRRYITPLAVFEDLEMDGVMNDAFLSQWSITVDNAADDNDDEHGGGIGGSNTSGPFDPPEDGD